MTLCNNGALACSTWRGYFKQAVPVHTHVSAVVDEHGEGDDVDTDDEV